MADHEQAAVVVKDLYKSFKLPHEQHSGVKQILVNILNRKRGYEQQKVLNNISFEIKKGEFFGIVGRNGSGKSTLLKLLAGIYVPDKGLVQINGSLTPFIELGVGFNPELTGRENVFMNGALLGFSKKEMEAMYDDIVGFAELENFMDQKLKNYSSGMQVRLAFSIAIRADSDVLLLDEVLAVGDAIFQKKCYDYFRQLKRDKKTVILVSHDSNILQEYCTSGILIEKGRIVDSGPIHQVVMNYADVLNKEEEKLSAAEMADGQKARWGSGDAQVTQLLVSKPTSQKSQMIFTGKDAIIHITATFTAHRDIESPVCGITITDSMGQRVFQSNTLWSQIKTRSLQPGEELKVSWDVPNVFNTGTFNISPAIADYSGSTIYDWYEGMREFKVRKVLSSSAIINTDHEIKVI